ncbi:MAG: DUF86 domain-containing protein [Clostridiales bacterium]|jgi:uncharacterized protein with HEPN domain|nr:DUF86 domain-containing protein [Clostridiales bacterium]
MKNRDAVLLNKIVKYCDEAILAVKEYQLNLNRIQMLSTPRNAIGMCILQIGELVTALSEEVKTAYSGVPWQQIKSMRNIAAHNYLHFDIAIMWDTIKDDVPVLRAYCLEILDKEPVDGE